MQKYFFLMAVAIAALGITACSDNDDNPTQQGQQTSGIDMSNLDTSVLAMISISMPAAAG